MSARRAAEAQRKAFERAGVEHGACVFVSFAYANGRFRQRNVPRLVVYEEWAGVNFVDTSRPYSSTTAAELPPSTPTRSTSALPRRPSKQRPASFADAAKHLVDGPPGSERSPDAMMTCPHCGAKHRVRREKRHLNRCPKARHRVHSPGPAAGRRRRKKGRGGSTTNGEWSCGDCARVFMSQAAFAQHRLDHTRSLARVPSRKWTQSGEVSAPRHVATGWGMPGGLPSLGKR